MPTKRKKPVPFIVYILECADGSYYTGITSDLDRRVKQHNSGNGARYTASHGPVKCVYTERKRNRSLALKREFAIKRLPRARKTVLITP